MPTTHSEFSKRLAFGVVAESTIANWLRSRGNSILPVYELEIHQGKGPRLFAPDAKLIAPDMLAMNKNATFWVEAKHKTVFSWHRKSCRWVTGIDLHHYEDYLSIVDRYSWEVWLLFLHRCSHPDSRDIQQRCPAECPTGLFAGCLSKLRDKENHRHFNHGPSGMVYWARESLTRVATLDEIGVAKAA